MSGEYNRSDLASSGAHDSVEPGSPSPAPATVPTTSNGSAAAAGAGIAAAGSGGHPKAVDDVMYSDIGVTTLLNRLKQSIASARDFAAFLKKRSKLEEEQASGLKHLAKSQLDSLRRIDMRGESYAMQLAEVMRTHERMGDNGMQFALSLHQMHEDLNSLSTSTERERKQWKHEGLDAEKKASDAENAMQKAKARYDSLAEDYDRARTGDTKGSRRIGLKGPKSAEQYESDLLRKVQAADADYEEKVRLAKAQRESLIKEQRPKAVKALKDLCRECDSGLTLQLQKFATFNEKLLLGNGLAVSPLTGEKSGGQPRSLRDVIYDIDNEADFHNYVGGHVSRIPARVGEIKYEQHPTLAPKTQQPTGQNASYGASASQHEPHQLPPISTGSASQSGSMGSRYAAQPPPSGPTSAPPQSAPYGQPKTPSAYDQQTPSQPNYGQAPAYGQSPSYGSSPAYGSAPPPQQQSPYSPQQISSADPYNNQLPPYPTGPADRYSPQQTTGTIPLPSQQRRQSGPMSPSNGTHLPPARPAFGVSLEDLYQRDQSAVPMVVIQCILAVDHFGLEVEGIYRLSGTSSHVNMLREAFDRDPNSVDFRNPASFYHDVNSVATLLKAFFRDLPDPLFTSAAYSTFIQAARHEDEVSRRDGLHQAINDLPDPNYATLRALVLHLHRVMGYERKNRMGSANLALCFAPSLMGTPVGSQIADASLQARAVQTILDNAGAIFDED